MLVNCETHSGLPVPWQLRVQQLHTPSSQGLRGCCACAGLRQSAQTFGAMVGASIAAATFKLSGSNYIATFALSAIPAVIALCVVTVVRA